MLKRVQQLLSRITCTIFDTTLNLLCSLDNKGGERVYIQIQYNAPCTKTGDLLSWKGDKIYLSEHMTDDEIVKKAYVAFERAVKHEIMEGFKVDGIVLFNPHVNFEELLKISHLEVKREIKI